MQDGVVTQRQAAGKMGVSDRCARKLLARMKSDGDAAVAHGLRGRSSNRRMDEQTQARVVELLKQPEWYDFGLRWWAGRLRADVRERALSVNTIGLRRERSMHHGFQALPSASPLFASAQAPIRAICWRGDE